MNTTLILVRHGQTDSNLNHRYQGQTDVPMNRLGRAQIKAAAAHLSGVKPAAVYSSTLARAREAADIIGRALGVEATAVPELRERSFGHIEGLTRDEAAERFPESWQIWQTNRAAWVPPGGESLGEMWGRVLGAMEQLWERHAGQTFIYVGHGGPINAILCNALGASEEARRAIAIGNGSIAIVTRNETGPVVVMVNETCHLSDLPADIDAD